MSKKIKIVDVERFIMSAVSNMAKKIIKFFKVRIQYRKDLLFLWKNLDKRWRIFAACYVRSYDKDYANAIRENIENIKMFNKFIPNIVSNKAKSGSMINYGFLNKDRIVKPEDLKFKVREMTLGDVDNKMVKDL